MPLLLMALTGVVMSFEWANALLFRLAGSPVPVSRQVAGNRGQREFHRSGQGVDPNYDRLLGTAMTLNRGWHTITLNMAQSANSPISGSVDTGTGGQPQKRSSYLLDRETGTVMKRVDFSDGSLGQRLRAFVRFGHTGEWGGLLGQTVAALASLGACVLVYTGISLSVRRLLAKLKAGRRDVLLGTELRLEQPVGYLSSAVGELGKDRKMG